MIGRPANGAPQALGLAFLLLEVELRTSCASTLGVLVGVSSCLTVGAHLTSVLRRKLACQTVLAFGALIVIPVFHVLASRAVFTLHRTLDVNVLALLAFLANADRPRTFSLILANTTLLTLICLRVVIAPVGEVPWRTQYTLSESFRGVVTIQAELTHCEFPDICMLSSSTFHTSLFADSILVPAFMALGTQGLRVARISTFRAVAAHGQPPIWVGRFCMLPLCTSAAAVGSGVHPTSTFDIGIPAIHTYRAVISSGAVGIFSNLAILAHSCSLKLHVLSLLALFAHGSLGLILIPARSTFLAMSSILAGHLRPLRTVLAVCFPFFVLVPSHRAYFAKGKIGRRLPSGSLLVHPLACGTV